VINAFGGLEAFYSRFYISAVCPLGFTNLSTNLSTNHSTNLSANLSSYGVHESVFSSPQQPLSTNLSSYEVHESVLSIQPPKRREVNYNYYDSRELTSAMMDFIVESLQTQLTFGINRDICFCFGTGKNEKFLNELNNRYGFFKRIIALEHPRYIMQYKAKSKEAYIAKYLEAFGH